MIKNCTEREVPIIVIWFLIEIICSCGSFLPSKDGKSGGLKFSGTWSSPISSKIGLKSRSSSSSSSPLVLCICWSVWTLSCKDSLCWHKFSTIVKSCAMSDGVRGSLLLGDDPDIMFLWCNILFCVAWKSFTEAPQWTPNVPDKRFLDNLLEAS